MNVPEFSFWHFFKNRVGAFSVCEALALYNICLGVPQGTYLELGSYKLKSASAAAIALKDGDFYLVDPLYFEEQFCREAVENVLFRMNMILVGSTSFNEIPNHDNLAYVFIDSENHGEEIVMREVELLEDRVMQNGVIAFHDYKSQFVPVEYAYNYLLSTGKYEEIKIDWDEIISYAKEHDLEKGNNSWHHEELEFPCFIGALKRK